VCLLKETLVKKKIFINDIFHFLKFEVLLNVKTHFDGFEVF
jgi:hypothetical protein